MMKPQIILIHPPVRKPSEPPAGIARLASCLRANGIPYQVIDANQEGLLFLLGNPAGIEDGGRWTKRAHAHREENLADLRQKNIYASISRYGRIVADLNRLLQVAGSSSGTEISLSDYHADKLSPVRSTDLLQSASVPEKNPFYRYFQNRLTAALAENPAYCGFSVNYLSQAICAFAMIGFIKKQNPRQKIILGGSLITSWLKTGMRRDIFSGFVDAMVEGPGEKPLLNLLGKTDGKTNCRLTYADFAYDEYLAPGRIVPYSAALGCYWHSCSFCPEKAEGNQYQAEPAQAAAAELQRLNKDINPVLNHILDSAVSPVLLQELAQQPPGAPWYGFARVTPQLTDADFCLALRRVGCVMLKLGIESGDQNVLDALHKGINLSTAAAALRTLKQAGIFAYVYLLLGTPPEDEASALQTLAFVLRNKDYIDFLNLAIFNLPILSAEAPALATKKFYDGDLSLYSSFRHPLGWERRKVRIFLQKTFKKNPAVAAILQRTPPFFTSNHAPFFALNKAIEI